MQAVSNTSPLSCLASLELLHLLPNQFDHICIPEAVRMELGNHPHAYARRGIDDLIQTGFLQVHTIKNADLKRTLRASLDEGESEAICLALEWESDFLLLDEKDGRKVARSLDLTLTGTLGILLKAKNSGIIPSLRSVLQILSTDFGFSLHPNLIEQACTDVGE